MTAKCICSLWFEACGNKFGGNIKLKCRAEFGTSHDFASKTAGPLPSCKLASDHDTSKIERKLGQFPIWQLSTVCTQLQCIFSGLKDCWPFWLAVVLCWVSSLSIYQQPGANKPLSFGPLFIGWRFIVRSFYFSRQGIVDLAAFFAVPLTMTIGQCQTMPVAFQKWFIWAFYDPPTVCSRSQWKYLYTSALQSHHHYSYICKSSPVSITNMATSR